MEHRRWFIPPSPPASAAAVKDAEARFATYERLVMGGGELELDSATLSSVFLRLGEDSSEYRFEHDRDERRRWLLTTDDRLTEVEPYTDGVWTRVARAAGGEP